MITKKLIKPISKVGVANANVNLDNYYNKSEVDSQVNTINNEIATKQDTLIAGNNISILNNVISANVDLSNYYTRSEVDSLIKTITFGSQATFHYVDGLNVNTQRYRWYRVDTSRTPLNANNCLNIEYKTTDPKEITFSYKWESDTSILLTFCKVNGQQDFRAIGTLIAKYI